MGLFGKKDDKKKESSADVFDLKAGVSLKAPTMREWTLTEDDIDTGKEKVALSEITQIKNDVPSNKLMQGVVQIFLKSGKFHTLGYSFAQKETAAKAVAYIDGKIAAALTPDQQAAKAELDEFKAGKERRMRCNVCGTMFCYTYQDLVKNEQLAKQARSATLRGALNTISTSQILGAQQQAEADRLKAQIKDFTHCPNCNSTDLSRLSDDEYKAALAAKNAPAAAAVSPMDELKKMKELLDMGIVTQEEFDAKKKQLLGL